MTVLWCDRDQISILPWGGEQLGNDGFIMLMAIWRDSMKVKRAVGRMVGFWKNIQSEVEKIKVVGWVWEYFWCIGVSFLSKNWASPAKINLISENYILYINVVFSRIFPYIIVRVTLG